MASRAMAVANSFSAFCVRSLRNPYLGIKSISNDLRVPQGLTMLASVCGFLWCWYQTFSSGRSNASAPNLGPQSQLPLLLCLHSQMKRYPGISSVRRSATYLRTDGLRTISFRPCPQLLELLRASTRPGLFRQFGGLLSTRLIASDEQEKVFVCCLSHLGTYGIKTGFNGEMCPEKLQNCRSKDP